MNHDSAQSHAADVVAIVVSYQPDWGRLTELLRAVALQTESVVVVDNGSDQDVASSLAALGDPRLHLLPLGQNLGVAAAHNAGIRWAKERGANFVLLMDQDSVPDPGMVASLRSAHEELISRGQKVAAVGPRFRDSDSGRISQHVRFGKLYTVPVKCLPEQNVVKTDFLISSGSLISMDVLDALGEMEEGFFIDHVDTEWVLRARAKGYMAWGHCEAVMSHSLGESRRRVWFGRWREVPFHKPFRYYYIYRNSILLHRRRYVCWAWRRIDLMRLLQIFVFMAMFHPNRFEALHMMLRGLWDGVRKSQ
ncbi:rhamnosyltransferase [Paraburkholderia sp. BL8N3]|nr:glycosyltransferase family 2 protein [Paraburkholderia sp. BL8N3]TCK42740.1 rhamnosyltransferase [Paraburkholderia sp. BL8N3]